MTTALAHYTAVRDLIGEEDLANIKTVLDFIHALKVVPGGVFEAAGTLMDIIEPGRIAEDGSNMNLEDLLTRAAKEGHFLIVYHDDPRQPDYVGGDVDKALEAIRACDEMKVIIRSGAGSEPERLAWLFCVQQGPDMDPLEEISDCCGPWLEEIGYVSV
jgi:hypothetical protein